jgi:hypothetical protein
MNRIQDDSRSLSLVSKFNVCIWDIPFHSSEAYTVGMVFSGKTTRAVAMKIGFSQSAVQKGMKKHKARE